MPPPQPPSHQQEALRRSLVEDAGLNLNFLALTVSACIIATLGLLVNSPAVIIGAMIIAPLMLPLRALAMAALNADSFLLRQSLSTLGIGTLVSIIVSGFVGGLFGVPAAAFGSEILARTRPNLADLGVALAAGAISAFAKVRPQIGDALAGTAISVALMPPLCVVGIAFSQGDWLSSGGAFLLYLTNFLGITVACLLVFIWGGYAMDFRQMRRALLASVGAIALLVIPLFFSLWNLIRQARLAATIQEVLQRETITVGQKASLVDLTVQWPLVPWSQRPPVVFLTVRALKPITPTQVGAVEAYLSKRLNQSFRLIFRVAQYEEIDAGSPTPVPEPLESPLPSPSPSPQETQVPLVEPLSEDPTSTLTP